MPLKPTYPKDVCGFVNQALQCMITRRFGLETWERIRSMTEARLSSPFILTMFYDDKMASTTVQTASEVLGLTMDEIWEMFGETFYDFCEESGYDNVLTAMGDTMKEFLENLDVLHDHLSAIYPSMSAPSFRCSAREVEGAYVVHFRSEKPGLKHVVIGLIKVVARRLHGKDVDVEIVNHSSKNPSDHVQFFVTERTTKRKSQKVSEYPTCDPDQDDIPLSHEQRLSPFTFCKAFPFHIMFNRNFQIAQVGFSITRVVKELEDPNFTFEDIFEIVRPQIDLSFDEVVANSNTVFIVKVRDRVKISKRKSICDPCPIINGKLRLPHTATDDLNGLGEKRIRLKGQMLYVRESDKMLYLCSPCVDSLEKLLESGLYLSDIPAHDSTRDLLLLSEQFRAEYELTQRLEAMTDKLQQTYKELEIEKRLTDKLVYSILPPTVANKLRENQPVEAVKYDSVTILFSGICEFNVFCTNNPPLKVVNLLNELYTKFDALADPRVYNVYKVETVGDKYMLASGLPEKTPVHARNIAMVALDMMDIARAIVIEDRQVKLTIGVHSGPVVAGVVGQKLPRFAAFGSTVCLASRMESAGLPGCINISETTYKDLRGAECFDPQFCFKERGDVLIKGVKSPIKCYLLTRSVRKLPKVLLQSGLAISSSHLSPLGSLIDGSSGLVSMDRRRSTGDTTREITVTTGGENYHHKMSLSPF